MAGLINTYTNSMGGTQSVGSADYGLQNLYNTKRNSGLNDDQIAAEYGYKAQDLAQFHAGYQPTPAPAPTKQPVFGPSAPAVVGQMRRFLAPHTAHIRRKTWLNFTLATSPLLG